MARGQSVLYISVAARTWMCRSESGDSGLTLSLVGAKRKRRLQTLLILTRNVPQAFHSASGFRKCRQITTSKTGIWAFDLSLVITRDVTACGRDVIKMHRTLLTHWPGQVQRWWCHRLVHLDRKAKMRTGHFCQKREREEKQVVRKKKKTKKNRTQYKKKKTCS